MIASTINILTEETVNKIAAGEVIERPASAVKELVENSLDAGSKKIVISLEGGGKDLIKVIDNGCGIPKAEISKAWQRHATSKICIASDLEQVGTMGFRGEALSSIAAVADLKIETRQEAEESGTEITVSGGKEVSFQEIGRNPGTSVSVRNIFTHIPARKKFMASSRSEISKIIQVVTRLSLAHHESSFIILDGNREIFSVNQHTQEKRVAEVFGPNVHNEMVPVEWENGEICLRGYAGTPEQCRGRSSHQFFYVNNRCVRSAMLSRAFAQGYGTLPPGKRPIGVVFIDLPREVVDVNVHPSKREVRFLNESQVFSSLVTAVRQSLKNVLSAPSFEYPDVSSTEGFSSSFNEPGKFMYVAESKQQEDSAHSTEQTSLLSQDQTSRNFQNLVNWPDPLVAPHKNINGNQSQLQDETPVTQIPYLQLHNRFILFEVQSGLMIVNQRAAHERVLYEQALDSLKSSNKFSSQQLLFTEILEVGKEEAHQINDCLHYFHLLGFDLDYFGGETFQLRGIPTEMNQNKARQVILEMSADLQKNSEEAPELLTRIARAYAGRAGIETGEPLDHQKMANLIDRLFATKNPWVSPSGKVVIHRYRLEEFNRHFKINSQ
ncbi:DNA mismatch repair endonuclease MutL [Fibrobacterota bacterium]